jgi:CubicO group peptidase (beta-lactamase class C family)
MRSLAALLTLLLVFVSASCVADSGLDTDRLDEVVVDLMEEHGVPGVSLAVIDDFAVAYVRSYGHAEPGRPATPDTLFQAASLSKPVAAVVAAEIAEQGRVDLEADVTTMLASWTLPPSGYDDTITLRMLFAHRAGINVPGFPGYRLSENLPGLDRLLLGVRDKNEPMRVVAQPGTERNYSGGGFLIAQLAIEDHTGRLFEDIAETEVFDVLGMELSTFRLFYPDDREVLAVGYRADGTEVAGGGWHQYPETAAGSMWTTAEEYAVLVADVMRSYVNDSGMVLDQATAELLLDPDFAVGFGVSREQGGIAVGHEGANEGYRSEFVAIPHLGQGVVLLTNSDSGLELTAAVVDEVAGQFSWPWTGWATPLWMFLLGLGLVVGGFTAIVRRRRKRREGSVPAESPAA